MAAKMTKEERRQNYERLELLFRQAVPDSQRFTVVYGYGSSYEGTKGLVVRTSTFLITNYAIGYDASALELVLLPVNRDLDGCGEPDYFKREDVKKAKYSGLMQQYTVYDKRIKGGYLQFSTPDALVKDSDEVCILIEQENEAKAFTEFFKTQFKK